MASEKTIVRVTTSSPLGILCLVSTLYNFSHLHTRVFTNMGNLYYLYAVDAICRRRKQNIQS